MRYIFVFICGMILCGAGGTLASWVGGWGSLALIVLALIVSGVVTTARAWRREWAEEARATAEPRSLVLAEPAELAGKPRPR